MQKYRDMLGLKKRQFFPRLQTQFNIFVEKA